MSSKAWKVGEDVERIRGNLCKGMKKKEDNEKKEKLIRRKGSWENNRGKKERKEALDK